MTKKLNANRTELYEIFINVNTSTQDKELIQLSSEVIL